MADRVETIMKVFMARVAVMGLATVLGVRHVVFPPSAKAHAYLLKA